MSWKLTLKPVSLSVARHSSICTKLAENPYKQTPDVKDCMHVLEAPSLEMSIRLRKLDVRRAQASLALQLFVYGL